MNCSLRISGIDCDKVVTADNLEYYTNVQIIYYWNFKKFKRILPLRIHKPWRMFLRNWVKRQNPGASPESKLAMFNRKKKALGAGTDVSSPFQDLSPTPKHRQHRRGLSTSSTPKTTTEAAQQRQLLQKSSLPKQLGKDSVGLCLGSVKRTMPELR